MIKKNMKGKVEETLVHNDDNSREIKKEKNISSSSFQIKIQGFKYKSCFSIFPFQQEAFDFFDSFDLQNNDSDGKNDENQNDPSTDDTKSNQESLCFSLERRLFALEYNAKGKRKYVVSHLGRFIQHYWKETNPSNRNHYELIREDTPCRLFFGKNETNVTISVIKLLSNYQPHIIYLLCYLLYCPYLQTLSTTKKLTPTSPKTTMYTYSMSSFKNLLPKCNLCSTSTSLENILSI